MSDKLPIRRHVVLGAFAVVAFAVLGVWAVGSRADADCRSAVSRATTAYKIEKALRSAACREAHRDALQGRDR